MTCHWCGDTHRSDQLCQRAQRGMTRRSFCFLFGAGVSALALGARPETKIEYVARLFDVPPHMITTRVTLQGLMGETASFETSRHDWRVGQAIDVTTGGSPTFSGIITSVTREL